MTITILLKPKWADSKNTGVTKHPTSAPSSSHPTGTTRLGLKAFILSQLHYSTVQ